MKYVLFFIGKRGEKNNTTESIFNLMVFTHIIYKVSVNIMGRP